jgi:hypothetical protein
VLLDPRKSSCYLGSIINTNTVEANGVQCTFPETFEREKNMQGLILNCLPTYPSNKEVTENVVVV